MKSKLLLALSPILALVPAIRAAAPAPRPEIASYFQPAKTEQLTLSPDGKVLAYTDRQADALLLVLHNLETHQRQRVEIARARAEELSGAREAAPRRLTFLQWGANSRLVFNLDGDNVWSIGADGSDARALVNANELAIGITPTRQVLSFEGETVELVHAPSTLQQVARTRQNLRVVAMPRDGRHVFLELFDAGLRVDTRTLMTGNVAVTTSPDLGRVVRRFDIMSGASTDVGEMVTGADRIITDREGYPRIAWLQRSPTDLVSDALYGPRKGHVKQPLDLYFGEKHRLNFTGGPGTEFAERSVPLGFGADPDVLYFASNVGRDTFGIYAIHLRTNERTPVAIETDALDLVDPRGAGNPLVYDEWRKAIVGVRYSGVQRGTLWFDRDLADMQKQLQDSAPELRWELLEWNRERTRFLVRATSQTEPGVFHVFTPADSTLFEVMSQMPWLENEHRHASAPFSVKTKEGVPLHGYLTLPNRSRLKRPPLVVLLHEGPGSRDRPGFDREAQALAAMGLAVVQINYRGSGGFGRRHVEAVRNDPDTAPVEDIVSALDFAITTGKVDPRFVAVMGSNYGGYLALRALQLHPTRFRCAVTIDAPPRLESWINPPSAMAPKGRGRHVPVSPVALRRRALIGTDEARLRAASPGEHADKITVPVMLIERDAPHLPGGRAFHAALRQLERDSTYVLLSAEESSGLPMAQAALFARIEEFFNVNIYEYAVKLGEATVVPDSHVPPPLPLPQVAPPDIDVRGTPDARIDPPAAPPQ